MKGIRKTKHAARWLVLGLAGFFGTAVAPAQDEPEDPLVQMVVDLVKDADRDMRALGFQQVREEVPGEAATKKFAELLPELAPDSQAGLLEALGDRGDAVARPAALESLKSQEEAVRAAAIKALGSLGEMSDVALLAAKAAEGSAPEKEAARYSLVRLRGDQVNAAILAAMAEGEPPVRVELLGVLAARNAKEALPKVLENAEYPEASVRLAAIEAIRYLAGASDTGQIVKILKAAKEDSQRRKAELALLVVCGRGGQDCARAVIDGLADADVPSRIALLHALARIGGENPLAEVVARLEDEDQAVRDEAVRMLSRWRDPAVKPHLLAIAKSAAGVRQQVLAVRGLVRLAGSDSINSGGTEALAEALGLAQRPQEIRLILGTLSGIGTIEALRLVDRQDPNLAEESGLAAVRIAEKIKDGDVAPPEERDQIQAVMRSVLAYAKNRQTRDRAQRVLDSL